MIAAAMIWSEDVFKTAFILEDATDLECHRNDGSDGA